MPRGDARGAVAGSEEREASPESAQPPAVLKLRTADEAVATDGQKGSPLATTFH